MNAMEKKLVKVAQNGDVVIMVMQFLSYTVTGRQFAGHGLVLRDCV
jgi:hypothetical protein